jgi:hypothetical protein
MIAIDILYLVDRLEALLSKGWRVPMTSKTMIDEDEFLDIVDQMRIAIPEEIKLAKKMQQDRERVLAQTQEEAARILAMAKDDSARLVSDYEVVRAAEERALAIEEQAKAEAVSIRAGADQYAAQVLTEIQSRLETIAQQVAGLQTQVYNGVTFISEQRGAVEVPSGVDQNVS